MFCFFVLCFYLFPCVTSQPPVGTVIREGRGEEGEGEEEGEEEDSEKTVEKEKREEKRLAVMMMSKKRRRLYDKVRGGGKEHSISELILTK